MGPYYWPTAIIHIVWVKDPQSWYVLFITLGLVLVNETKGTIENFKDVSAEVLLLNGSKTFLFLKHIIAALNEVLPNVERVEIEAIDHAAAEDITGKPEIVAHEIKRFWSKIWNTGNFF